MISRRTILLTTLFVLPTTVLAFERATTLSCFFQEGTPALPFGVSSKVNMRTLKSSAWLPQDWVTTLKRQDQALLARMDSANHLLLREFLREHKSFFWYEENHSSGNLIFAGWSAKPPVFAKLILNKFIDSTI